MEQDLFSYQEDRLLSRNAPLADRLRPKTLDEFVGQKAILAEGRLLRRAIAADRVGSLLFHGPPGVGKTTLARIIASNTRSHFTILNAVLVGVKELRKEVDAARQRLQRHGLRTILFIDEVHRFNSAQQDALLPWVENGTITLIGATTENPFFEVNKALLSRFRLFRLQPLEKEDLRKLLKRALSNCEDGYGNRVVEITKDGEDHLLDISNGDARSLLNALELAVESTPLNSNGSIKIDLRIAEESIQERAVLYDKDGDAHYDTISAFIKSLRGSDPDAALFWLARMLEAGESPKFIFRRMLILASEDIGLADPQAIVIIEACASAFERIGLPEGFYSLAQATIYLATTDKSNSLIAFFSAQSAVRSAQNQNVPSQLRDSHRDEIASGDGQGYRYPHSFADHWVAQQYLPEDLQGEVFWEPSYQGWEGKRRRLILERRAIQMATFAESQQENPLLLTSGPEIPSMQRWIHRQLAQEGNRMQTLSNRLWSQVNFQRNQRILIISSNSLLWSLYPINHVPEGSVSIFCKNKEEYSKLSSQLALLDSLYRPYLINKLESFNNLSSEIQFEWVGGRINSQDINIENIDFTCHLITNRAIKNTGLRILFTCPLVGPAEALKEIRSPITKKENILLQELIEIERCWLDKENNKDIFIEKLKSLGWEIHSESWEECTNLQVDRYLEHRWLSPGSNYQKLALNIDYKENLLLIKNSLRACKGKYMPQKLVHYKIQGVFY